MLSFRVDNNKYPMKYPGKRDWIVLFTIKIIIINNKLLRSKTNDDGRILIRDTHRNIRKYQSGSHRVASHHLITSRHSKIEIINDKCYTSIFKSISIIGFLTTREGRLQKTTIEQTQIQEAQTKTHLSQRTNSGSRNPQRPKRYH